MSTENLPRWSVTDLHDSMTSRSFVDAMERIASEVGRFEALFDELGIRAPEDKSVDGETGRRADAAISKFNEVVAELDVFEAYVYASVTTDTRDETAQSLLSDRL